MAQQLARSELARLRQDKPKLLAPYEANDD